MKSDVVDVIVCQPGLPPARAIWPMEGILKRLQGVMGGLVTLVHCDGLDFWAADELSGDEPLNLVLRTGAAISGPVVVARTDAEGDIMSVTDDDYKALCHSWLMSAAGVGCGVCAFIVGVKRDIHEGLK